MAPSVFISHASRDRKVADAICTALESRGFDCWIAFRDVGPGQNFGEEISLAIRAVKVMVLVFSSHANNSDEIKKEVVLAGRAKVPVIPLRVEEVEPTGAFEYELVTRQWIDLFADWDRAVDGLARQVRMALEAAGSPVPPLRQPVAAPVAPPAPPPPTPEPTPEPAPESTPEPAPPAAESAPAASPSQAPTPASTPLASPPAPHRNMVPLLAGGGVAALAVVGLLAWGMSGKPEPKAPETATAAAQPPAPVAPAAPPPATIPPATAPAPPPAARQAQPSPAPPVAAAPVQTAEVFQRGVVAFQRKDYAAALGAARQAADAGHAEAALLVAWINFKGYGTAQNYAEAMRWYRVATDRGVIEAPNEIGWLHYKGLGVDQDYAEAMRWFRKGDAMGDTSAMLNIGAMYRDGTGVKEDQAEAVRWYRKVADAGTQPMGQALVGVHYQIGQGVEQDYAEAMRWYQAALAVGESGAGRTKGAKAEPDSATLPGLNPATAWFRAENDEDEGKNQARVLIGTLYENGLGVRRDYDAAMRWYRLAAERNFSHAFYAIGVMYEKGRGVPEDLRQAREWMKKAADRGFEDAKKWLASH